MHLKHKVITRYRTLVGLQVHRLF